MEKVHVGLHPRRSDLFRAGGKHNLSRAKHAMSTRHSASHIRLVRARPKLYSQYELPRGGHGFPSGNCFWIICRILILACLNVLLSFYSCLPTRCKLYRSGHVSLILKSFVATCCCFTMTSKLDFSQRLPLELRRETYRLVLQREHAVSLTPKMHNGKLEYARRASGNGTRLIPTPVSMAPFSE